MNLIIQRTKCVPSDCWRLFRISACRRAFLPFLAFLGFNGPHWACTETLPPRIEPRLVFVATIEGHYTLTMIENNLRLYLTFQNVYDQTIQDTLSLDGNIEIIFNRAPTLIRSIRLRPANIVTPHVYDPTTGMITLAPQSGVVFTWTWDFITDDSTDMRTLFSYYNDTTCRGLRMIANPEVVTIRGALRLTRRTPEVILPPTAVRFCYVTDIVETALCPPVHTACDSL
jgi:hypothetical protein